MPRVRFLQAVAGDDFSYVAGDVVDMPGARAETWADGVRAELVRGETPATPERAAPKPETAAAAPPKDTAAAAQKPAPRRHARSAPAGKRGPAEKKD